MNKQKVKTMMRRNSSLGSVGFSARGGRSRRRHGGSSKLPYLILIGILIVLLGIAAFLWVRRSPAEHVSSVPASTETDSENGVISLDNASAPADDSLEGVIAQAKLLAEAEGMERKAEAYAKYNNAAVIEMMVNIMPQMAAEIAKPLSSIDKVNIYGGGGESGVGQISGNAATVMQQVFDTMSEATGVDFREILKAQTYDAKVNHNLNLTGIPESVKITPEPIKKAPETVDTTEKTAPEPTE